ncbi:hypothetical protein AWB71_04461 [Caballeronia peredens]|nr:hypothetical protein AWB71_04461 [Caballeronia peredens]
MTRAAPIIFESAVRSVSADAYAVLLIRNDIDRHKHNETFARELVKALSTLGVRLLSLDYVRDIRQLSEAMRDDNCQFFVCFNGFGSELVHASGTPGKLVSAFELWRKPLFDLMHDCPVHETMQHQFKSVGQFRKALFTDYSYAHLSRMLGARSVQTVPSITFPEAVPVPTKPLAIRSIEILLPVGLCDPQVVIDRFRAPVSYRDRLFRELFDSVTAIAVDDLTVDPLTQTLIACQEGNIAVNFQDPDIRFLVTAILDYVKFARRDRLVRAISRLPVTVVSDRDVSHRFAGSKLRLMKDRSFPELIDTMGDSKIVLCPLPHYTGFHERALAAFTAGATVFAAPNEVLETNFWQGRDMLTYRTPEHLASLLDSALAGQIDLQEMASNGERVARERFSPDRLARIVVSQWKNMPR